MQQDTTERKVLSGWQNVERGGYTCADRFAWRTGLMRTNCAQRLMDNVQTKQTRLVGGPGRKACPKVRDLLERNPLRRLTFAPQI
jgi:hypothetical protein